MSGQQLPEFHEVLAELDPPAEIRWIATDRSPLAGEARGFLDAAFRRLPVERQARIIKDLQSDREPSKVEATCYEILTHELLFRLGGAPVFDPGPLTDFAGRSLTPDLLFVAGGVEFVADVFVTHNPKGTFEDFGDSGWAKDKGERGQKIASTIIEKAGRYRGLGRPLVLFVYMVEHLGMDVHRVVEALLGLRHSTGEFTRAELTDPTLRNAANTGLYLADDMGQAIYPHLAAVVAGRWLDSLDAGDHSKRLHCLPIHHWGPTVALPTSFFGGFQQIIWTARGPERWAAETTRKRAVYAKLPVNGGTDFRDYLADEGR